MVRGTRETDPDAQLRGEHHTTTEIEIGTSRQIVDTGGADCCPLAGRAIINDLQVRASVCTLRFTALKPQRLGIRVIGITCSSSHPKMDEIRTTILFVIHITRTKESSKVHLTT